MRYLNLSIYTLRRNIEAVEINIQIGSWSPNHVTLHHFLFLIYAAKKFILVYQLYLKWPTKAFVRLRAKKKYFAGAQVAGGWDTISD